MWVVNVMCVNWDRNNTEQQLSWQRRSLSLICVPQYLIVITHGEFVLYSWLLLPLPCRHRHWLCCRYCRRRRCGRCRYCWCVILFYSLSFLLAPSLVRTHSLTHARRALCVCVCECEHLRLLRFFFIRFRAVYIFSVFLLCVYLCVCVCMFSKCVALCVSIIIVERLCHCTTTTTIHTFVCIYYMLITFNRSLFLILLVLGALIFFPFIATN